MNYRFVDRILSLDVQEGRIETLKAFPRTEAYLDETFRNPSKVPPSLILETLATSGSLLVSARFCYEAIALLLKVEEAQFFKAVSLGDRVLARSKLLGISGEVAQIGGEALVGETLVAQARLLFLSVPLTRIAKERREILLSGLLERLGLGSVQPSAISQTVSSDVRRQA